MMKMMFCLVGAVCGLTAVGAFEPNCAEARGWTFNAEISDEFASKDLDRGKWDDWIKSFPGRSAGEKGSAADCRTGFMFAPENVAVENGELVLTARFLDAVEKTRRNEYLKHAPYAVSICRSRRKQAYGYYEIRAKTMKACVSNAFWLYDPHSDDPDVKFRKGDFSEEIDVFEVTGKADSRNPKHDCTRNYYNTLHYYATPYLEAIVNIDKLRPYTNTCFRAGFDFSDDYHVYGLLWTPEKIVWYLDGKVTREAPNEHFHRPLHVTLDSEVFTGWFGFPDPADLPAKFRIDYVRVWEAPAPRNTALVPRTKIERDSYDWFDRHNRIMRDKGRADVVFIGDSITHFWAGRYSIGGEDALPRWKKAFGDWKTLNLGYGWDRTGNVLWRLDHGELDGVDPQVVVLHIGGNNYSKTRHYPGNTAEEVAEAVLAIMKKIRAKAPRARIVTMGVFPFGEKPSSPHRVKAKKTNAILAEEVEKFGNAVFVDITDRQIVGLNDTYPKALANDFVHPTDAGYEIWANAIRSLFPCGGASLKAGESKVYDFGADGVGGYPCVSFTATEGKTRVRISYSTHPDGLGPKGDFWHETRANYMGPQLWLPILPANTDRFDVFEQEGPGRWRAPLAQGLVRYAKVTVESGAATIGEVSFANDGIHSEEPVVGSFACSDERINGAWKASVRTCQLAAIPARTAPLAVCGTHTNAILGTTYAYLSDGAKRDRLVWSGDLWFAQGNMYAAFASTSPYMPGSIRMLAENRTPEGYVQACPFPESHGPLRAGDYGPFASDEFAAWFIPVLCDHVLHTGDLDLAREMRPVVRDLVAYLVRHTGADGIFEQRIETCKHSCGLAVGGTSLHHRSYMNVLNAIAYRDAARLAAWLGDETDRAAWTALAERTGKAVRTAFWDEAKGHFRLSREEPTFGFEANALALAANFATESEAKRILPQLKHNWHGKFQLLAVRGAFNLGQGDKALELVEAHNWFKYLDPNWQGLRTVQECCNMGRKGWGDEAHPDACIAGVFTAGILGVRPVEPGYRRFVFDPVPPKGVDWAEGSVPTPRGFIKVRWRRVNGTIEKRLLAVPPGCVVVSDKKACS